jgi:signal transduction histidine kinase
MRAGRLFFRLYLGCVLALVIAGTVLIAFVDGGRAYPNEAARPLARYVAASLVAVQHEPAALKAQLMQLRQSGIRLSVFDRSGRLIGSTLDPPPRAPDAAVLTRLAQEDELMLGGRQAVYAIRQQGVLSAIGVLRWEATLNPRFFVRACGLLLGFLLFAALFARYLSKPLQQLASAAQRFGRGDLNARAQLARNDEIGEAGRAFDEMAERVRLLIASQQELMANVSHELQTPISRIHVALEHIALRGVERARELLPEIAVDLAELQRLFDDVMMVARLDLSRSHGQAVRTPLRLEEFALSALLQQVAARFRAEHSSHELVVQGEGSLPVIQADRVLLRRVLDNLLENARKYSDAGTAILLCTRITDHVITIEVRDQGIGIDDADLRQLFTPFFRSDRSRSRQTGGVGLGLALARRVVEAHGGTIEVQSMVGSGTTVTVTLPQKNPRSAP